MSTQNKTKSDAYILSGGGVIIKCEDEEWEIEAEICYGSGYVATGHTLIEAVASLVKQVCEDAKNDEAIAWCEEVKISDHYKERVAILEKAIAIQQREYGDTDWDDDNHAIDSFIKDSDKFDN